MYAIIGYIASAFLALSLLVNNALKFRWFNTLGNVAFIIYGVMINAFPVIVANSILLCINIFQLIKLYRAKETFEMLAIAANEELVKKFLKFYKKDIQKFFPRFEKDTPGNKIGFAVLRDLTIANIFIARINNDGTASVEINYTVERYRDYQVGRFIFEREKEYLIQHGIKKIIYEEVYNKKHEQFIKVMGFTLQPVHGLSCYTKELI